MWSDERAPLQKFRAAQQSPDLFFVVSQYVCFILYVVYCVICGAGMPPPMGAPPMGPPPGGPPDAKRQRTGGLVLEPEEEFLAKYPGPSKVLCRMYCCITKCCVLAVCMVSTILSQPVLGHGASAYTVSGKYGV